MTPRSESIDYAAQCTVCIDYSDGDAVGRLVYERAQMQLPDRPLTELDVQKLAGYPNDRALTEEARAIFADMKNKGRLGGHAELRRVFIARTAAAASEMGL